MSDELRAAAEDILHYWEENKGTTPVGVLANNAIALARAFLAEHPADADEPITPEWLERQPGWMVFYSEPSWSATKELPPFSHSRYPQWVERINTKLKLHHDGVLVISQGPDEAILWPAKITTRGQLRGLLRKMGA